MHKELQKGYNHFVTSKISSAYFYLSGALYFTDKDWPGFSHWMDVQSREQFIVASKFIDYIHHREGILTLGAIKKPSQNFLSIRDVFFKSFIHEKRMAFLMNQLQVKMQECRDSKALLHFEQYVHDQMEYQKRLHSILSQMELLKDDAMGLSVMDHEFLVQPQLKYDLSAA